jgi:hypothetical protein
LNTRCDHLHLTHEEHQVQILSAKQKLCSLALTHVQRGIEVREVTRRTAQSKAFHSQEKMDFDSEDELSPSSDPAAAAAAATARAPAAAADDDSDDDFLNDDPVGLSTQEP